MYFLLVQKKMAGGLELTAFVASATVISIAVLCALQEGMLRIIGISSLVMIVCGEVCYFFHLEKITQELEQQWLELRQAFWDETRQHMTADTVTSSETSNSKKARDVFPFIEFSSFVQTASPQLLESTLSPLLGFRRLARCSDAELFTLVSAIITLGNEVPSDSIILTYVSETVQSIRERVPIQMTEETYMARDAEGHGFKFWDMRPAKWHFPWVFLKLMELYETALLYKTIYKRELSILTPHHNFPVYVHGQLRAEVTPVIVFHGASCKFVAIYDNLMLNMPEGIPVIAPLFTPLWLYGAYTRSSHLVTVDEYFMELHKLLQRLHIKSIRVAGWSLGCLLATGFLRRYGSLYAVEAQVYIEPLGSLTSCCLTYASVCQPLGSVYSAFLERGGVAHPKLCFAFAGFLKNDALTRCYWKLLPFRNVFWGHESFTLPDSKETLLLVSRDDPLTYHDLMANTYDKAYFPHSRKVVRPGFHGTWIKSKHLAPILQEWFDHHRLPEGFR